MRKFSGAVLVALMVLMMAVTPLGAFLNGGAHETWLPGWGSGYGSAPRVLVVLQDRTGLVRSISPAADRLGSTPTVIVVHWTGGCGDIRTELTFERAGDGYVVSERTAASGCGFFIGYQRTVALHLWSPIDPALVTKAET